MLRSDPTNEQSSADAVRPDLLNAFPGVEEPYASLDRSAGILFYQAKQGFYLPYHHLKSMEFSAHRILLEFPEASVVITGRGLHGLVAGIARQSVWRIVEQGERATAAATCIARIRRISNEAGKPAVPDLDSD